MTAARTSLMLGIRPEIAALTVAGFLTAVSASMHESAYRYPEYLPHTWQH